MGRPERNVASRWHPGGYERAHEKPSPCRSRRAPVRPGRARPWTAPARAGHPPFSSAGKRGSGSPPGGRVRGRGRRAGGWMGYCGCQGIWGGVMSRLRRIAEIPAGSWTKWLVVGFWLVVVVVAFPLSNKLMGAEKNDASAWLPANAESTKVLDLQSHFQSPNIFPAVVVYQRASGLTAADRAKAAADARSFAGLHGVGP